MFDFLSKFGFGRSSESKKQALLASSSEQVERVVQAKQEQKQERMQQEQEAQRQMQAILLDEERLIKFLSNCTFPELRLQAAQHVKSKDGMEQVKKAFLKSDKRIVKLMQQGLHTLQTQQQQEEIAQACLIQAQKLQASKVVLASQVADLDKQKNACTFFPELVLNQFVSVRQQLELRLLAQTDLQRRSLDLLKHIRLSTQHDEPVAGQEIEQWQVQLQSCLQDMEAPSLPRHLIIELTQTFENTKIIAQQSSNAKKVDSPSAEAKADIDATAEQKNTVKVAEIEVVSTPENLSENKSALDSAVVATVNYDVKHLEQQLSQLETGLESGQIARVKNIERQLRSIDIKHWPESLRDRLQVALHEFTRMQSWAKWSGQVSREQLVQTAEELASLSLTPKEIQHTVSALRQQWKEMEQSASGGVGRELWQRFDAACTKAYAPAAQFFQEQAQLRQENANKAQQFLETLAQKIPSLLAEPIVWRTLQQSTHQIEKEWRSIGVIERKVKTSLDNQFEVLHASLQNVLNEQRQTQIQQRQFLISQAQKIQVGARNGVEQVKALQEQWQHDSTSSILRQQDEQKLWKEFRAACDAVFEQRKELGKQEQEQRLQNLAAKQAICLELEQALNSTLPQLKQLKNDAMQAWKTIGWVPKSEEANLDTRFQDALQKIDHAIAHFATQQLQLATQEFFLKFQLCLSLENSALTTNQENIPQLITLVQQQWQALPVASARTAITDIVQSLQQRFDKVIGSSLHNHSDLIKTLQANKNNFNSAILQLEIACSCETPEEFAAQRLQAQIQMLKDSMQQGKRNLIDDIQTFVSQPVALNEQEQQRSIHLLERALKLK
jgi:hypothetical protein